MGLILRASCWRPSLSMESRMQSMRFSRIAFVYSILHAQLYGDHCCKCAQILRLCCRDPLRSVHEPPSNDQVGNCTYSGSSGLSPGGLTVAQLGHSAVDVNLIGYATKRASANLEKIRGNHDNTGEISMLPPLPTCSVCPRGWSVHYQRTLPGSPLDHQQTERGSKREMARGGSRS